MRDGGRKTVQIDEACCVRVYSGWLGAMHGVEGVAYWAMICDLGPDPGKRSMGTDTESVVVGLASLVTYVNPWNATSPQKKVEE